MQKTIDLLATVVSVAMTMLISVNAASGIKIETESAPAKAGDTVTVKVNISGDASVAQLTVSVVYDETALTLTNQENGSVFTTNSGNFAEAKNHPYVSAAIVPNGTLFSMTFKVNDDAKAGSYDVGVAIREAYDGEGNPVEATASNGKITVEAPTTQPTTTQPTTTQPTTTQPTTTQPPSTQPTTTQPTTTQPTTTQPTTTQPTTTEPITTTTQPSSETTTTTTTRTSTTNGHNGGIPRTGDSRVSLAVAGVIAVMSVASIAVLKKKRNDD